MTSKTASPLITRREAILRVSSMLGGIALVGQGAMLAGCDEPAPAEGPAPGAASFSDEEIALLDTIAETILPQTDTPGAIAAGVGPFMALMVTDCYFAPEQRIFKDGMRAIDEQSKELHGVDFRAATPEQRVALLTRLDAEQMGWMQSKAADAPAHYFRMMKELALVGYFTSEVAYTEVLRYAETPGRYDPCVPYEPGERLWAPHASSAR